MSEIMRSHRYLKNLRKSSSLIVLLSLLFISIIAFPITQLKADSTGTDDCIDCHKSSEVLEDVIKDWEKSKHAKNNVTCIVCHETQSHDPDALSHMGFEITHVVSPNDCTRCHSKEAKEFEQSLHSFGAIYYEYLFSGEKLPYIESQMEGGYLLKEGEEMTHAATLRGCQACHGTNMSGMSYTPFFLHS
jgi:cytochrome c553